MKNQFELRGDYAAIFLRTREGVLETKVDTSDLPSVQAFPGTWGVQIGRDSRYRYAMYSEYVRTEDGTPKRSRTVALHRLIFGMPPQGVVVDHINHDTLDNRKCNLRVANYSLNCINRAKKSVWFNHDTGKWASGLMVKGERIRMEFENQRDAEMFHAGARMLAERLLIEI